MRDEVAAAAAAADDDDVDELFYRLDLFAGMYYEETYLYTGSGYHASSARLDSTRLGSTWLDSTRLDLGSARRRCLKPRWLRSARLDDFHSNSDNLCTDGEGREKIRTLSSSLHDITQ